MLLFTKPMPPKIRKKRARTGDLMPWLIGSCSHLPSKEARKKCCERKPRCTRCTERGLECIYNPVEPRRSKHANGIASKTPRSVSPTQHFKSRRSLEAVSDGGFTEPPRDAHSTSSHSPPETPEWASFSQFDFCDKPVDQLANFDRESDSLSSSRFDFVPLNAELSQPSTIDIASLLSGLEIPQPSFSNLTDCAHERKLIHHFSSVLSHLIVFTEEPDNLFQGFILPLCSDNSPVLHAMCAFAKGHLEYMGVQDSKHSSNYRVLAAEGVFQLVQQNCRQEEVLAATMLLVYYESLTLTGATNMVLEHLRSAFLVLSSIPMSKKTRSILFLEKAFQFYDVITALSLGRSPVSTVPATEHVYSMASPSSKSAQNGPVDPLLGMTGNLWPVLYRLSTLKSLKGDLDGAVSNNQPAKAAVLLMEYESTVKAVQKALQDWAPPVQSDEDFEPFCDSDSQGAFRAMVHNSMAYRHGALVYLNRSIHDHPVDHPAVQENCHLTLENCVAVIASGGPVNALLWPLFVAACEAITDQDRGLARYAFIEIERRQGMINIERARAVVLHQWAAATSGKSNGGCNTGAEAWREVAGSMGMTIIFG
ncbi:uncharacterized protein CCOS01_13405 [Colletotrichum costaricense]|uniref:Zn(2)-C6 fungal-type domain-containing protein n=1 Tax=Colletotrichum costaricense TaxID=1209916 RepID=A0AAJ0DVQ4_9PEZI|nr:uncharacterized protein CCOS01_13405 [Colletotrichum costaricense]KAK1515212.1 hypothetical protein CCOS01_13405 [Colletotrichum costaricense]